MRLSLQGIGATLTATDGYTKVVSIVPGGPADKNGQLQAGDRIIAVAQGDELAEDVIDLPLNKVVRKIRGDKGTKVRLLVLKESQSTPKEIVIVRDEVKLEEKSVQDDAMTIKVDGADFNIAYLKIPSFYADFDAISKGKKDARSTSNDVKRIIDTLLKSHNIGGVVLDLRNNGGGSLDECIKLTGLFIKEGPVVQVKERQGITVQKDTDGGKMYDLPLLVMVNKTSASASEIFSGAIQDYGRGIIVGNDRTHGKGSVQNIISLKRTLRRLKDYEPGALKFTMAKYYRVTGKSTQLKGVTADFIFPSYLDHLDIGEAELEHALKWDEIRSSKFKVSRFKVAQYLDALKVNSAKRLDGNKAYQHMLTNIKSFADRKKSKTLSLNKEKRLKLAAEEKLINDAFEKSLKLYDVADAEGDKRKNDLILQESLHILRDYIELSSMHNASAKAGASAK
jgi:carboxyl-terminal processing protease